MSKKSTKHILLSQTVIAIVGAIGVVVLLFFGTALYFMAREDWPHQIAQENIGDKQTVRIYAKTTWDNWCFVESFAVYDVASGKSTDLALGNAVFSEHCPDISKTPWIVKADDNSSSFKILTGLMNGTTYDTYKFNTTTHRYEVR